MKSNSPSGHDGKCKAKRTRAAASRTGLDRACVSIDVERSGDWMPADELWEAARTVLGKDLTVNLDKVGHLDASALQILLALDAEQKKQGHHLQLVNASTSLRQWFEYSGAAGHFHLNEQTTNE